MRDIKFRAWDKENRCMVYQEEMNGYIENKQYWFSLSETAVKLNVFDEDYKAYVQTDADIMEYTGLKDINGTEIYEGDIVKIEFDMYFMNLGLNENIKKHGNKYKFVGEVKYYDGAFNVDNNKEGYPLFHEISPVEIIGNIYENAELLERIPDEH